jgi:hypothetical protein
MTGAFLGGQVEIGFDERLRFLGNEAIGHLHSHVPMTSRSVCSPQSPKAALTKFNTNRILSYV